MRKIIVNEKEVITNYGENGMYTVVVGNDLPNYTMELKKDIRETDEEFLERLVEKGYTRIRFALTTTRVRGYYNSIAYCRREK